MEQLNSFKYDLLNRKNIAINLTNIIDNKKDLRVLAIDSKWSTGKTTFINMWMDMIKNDSTVNYKEKFEVMYFNAWENDYIEEPLIALLDEINEQIKDKEGNTKSLLNKTKDKIKPYAKIGGQIVLKYLTRGALDSVNLNDSLESGLEDFSDKVGEAIFESVSNSKSARIELKNYLIQFQEKVDKKVIIFIDELDRCRPTFAVELLETIKHIFDIENYIFVISLDKEQLSHSIKTLYGQGMDSNGYLRRFFDLEYNLPQDDLKDYIKIKNHNLNKNYKNTVYIERFLEEIFYLENYSLRDVDKAYKYIELLLPNIGYYNGSDNCNATYLLGASYIYAYFINLRIKRNDLLKDIKNFNYEGNSEYINRELITFDFNQINLSFNSFHGIQAKEVLEEIVQLYLELFYLSKDGAVELYKLKEEKLKKFKVGIKKDEGGYYYDSFIELDYLIYNDNIFKNIDFISNFSLD